MLELQIQLLSPCLKMVNIYQLVIMIILVLIRATNCPVADVNTRGYGLKPISTKDNPILAQNNIAKILTEKTKMRILHSKEGFIHAVDITPFFRFHDDVAIKIFENDGMTTIWLHSQSRLGIYDLKVNERRVQSLHKMISALE